jgi:hypothetical protein
MHTALQIAGFVDCWGLLHSNKVIPEKKPHFFFQFSLLLDSKTIKTADDSEVLYALFLLY